jgi:hypothetical protein
MSVGGGAVAQAVPEANADGAAPDGAAPDGAAVDPPPLHAAASVARTRIAARTATWDRVRGMATA